MQKYFLSDVFQLCLHTIRSHVMRWSAKHPALALTTIIFCCVILLPFITATALMPIVFLLDLGNFIATKGMMYVIYTLLFQGLVLGTMLALLFFAAFAIATSASVLQSYKFSYKKTMF